ncbi:hypothetical protein Tdes44962_MAKER01155 [Teratosphaeria destructans]|uniref:Uncharacterized protein n=1 Tax=Teratosphaeria destructans TaxID=418781 RepID=A0A9W7T308_9PEZI|nr:hypothetical protein Tdes44962_MAKER01155 [Teratosphaeria destructans]
MDPNQISEIASLLASATATTTAPAPTISTAAKCPRFTPLVAGLLVVITTLLLCLSALGAFYLKDYWLQNRRAQRTAQKKAMELHSDKLRTVVRPSKVYLQPLTPERSHQQRPGRMWPSRRESSCSDLRSMF